MRQAAPKGCVGEVCFRIFDSGTRHLRAKLVPTELEPLKIGIKKGEAHDTLKALEPAKRVLALEQERVEARTTLLSAETHVQKEASLGSKSEPKSISILEA